MYIYTIKYIHTYIYMYDYIIQILLHLHPRITLLSNWSQKYGPRCLRGTPPWTFSSRRPRNITSPQLTHFRVVEGVPVTPVLVLRSQWESAPDQKLSLWASWPSSLALELPTAMGSTAGGRAWPGTGRQDRANAEVYFNPLWYPRPPHNYPRLTWLEWFTISAHASPSGHILDAAAEAMAERALEVRPNYSRHLGS